MALKKPPEKTRIPLLEGDRIARAVQAELAAMTEVAIVAGSVRRRRPEVGDVELVVLPKDLDCFLFYVEQLGFKGGARKRVRTEDGFKTELYIAHDPDELGAMLLARTGDYLFNIAMRTRAKKEGWLLNDYGLWKGKTPVVQSPDERDYFDALGMKWHDPEDRSLAHRTKPEPGERRGGKAKMGDAGESLVRKVGYISLELLPPDPGSDTWTLRIERTDAYGGAPWQGDVDFEDEESARTWFRTIQGDEDLDLLWGRATET